MKKNICILLVMLVGSMSLNAQIEQLILKGDQAYRALDLEKAVLFYNKALEQSPESVVVKEKLAEVYLNPGAMYSTDMAMRYMEDAYKTGKMSNVTQSKYISLLQSQRNFEKASEVILNSNRNNRTKNSLMNAADISYYRRLSKPKANIILQNLRDVNSEFSDFSPSYYRAGLVFITTRANRNNTGFKFNQIRENYSDIFTTNLITPATQSFDKPVSMLGNQELKYMQGPVAFTGDQNNMFITRSFVKDNNRARVSSEDRRTTMLEIARLSFSNGSWSKASSVVLSNAPDAQNYSYAHPTFLNTSGTIMIFSSNMPGGFGGSDLWYTKREGSGWSTPINLGPEINTGGDEVFPYCGKGDTLYFASSGLPGLGGLDIYKTFGSLGSYSIPENLGAPFNSPYDDFGLITKSGKEGYLTSNRPNGVGDDDIYYWSNPVCNMAVKVYDAKTNLPIPNATVKILCTNKSYTTDGRGMFQVACFDTKICDLASTAPGYYPKNVSLKAIGDVKVINIAMDKESLAVASPDGCRFFVLVLDKETNLPIEGANVNIKGLTTADESNGLSKDGGRFKVAVTDQAEVYRISASKSNEDGSRYIGNAETFSCKMPKNANGDIVKAIYLTKARVGSKFKIENIYYDSEKWNIKSRAAQELDNIVNIMKSYPTIEIEMGSHSDCPGTAKYNELLSSKRAASAMEYIISKGIDRQRISSKGYGESELINGCACEGANKSTCSEFEHQMNRRTEFKIIKF